MMTIILTDALNVMLGLMFNLILRFTSRFIGHLVSSTIPYGLPILKVYRFHYMLLTYMHECYIVVS